MCKTGYIHFAIARSALADPAMESLYSTSIELHLTSPGYFFLVGPLVASFPAETET